MSNNFGCKLTLKADEHDVLGYKNYPFVLPKVFLEGYDDPELLDSGTESTVLIRGDKMVTYTRGSLAEIQRKDVNGNVTWVKSVDRYDFDDDHWDDEYEEDIRVTDVHTVTEYDFKTMEKKTYKVVLDEVSKLNEKDIQRAEHYLGGQIIDDCYVINNGVLKYCLRPNFNLVIPDSVVEIDEEVFSCAWYLEKISIPASLTKIPTTLFKNCRAHNIVVDEMNPRYYTMNGCLIDRYTSTLVWAYAGTTIPDDGSIKKIGVNAFGSGAVIRSIVIPDSVTEIESGAFRYCYLLEEISMPDHFADRSEDIFGQKFVKEGGIWKVIKVERNFIEFYS